MNTFLSSAIEIIASIIVWGLLIGAFAWGVAVALYAIALLGVMVAPKFRWVGRFINRVS